MINREVVFMGQVIELSRLYRIQIAMSEDIKHGDADNDNFHVGGMNSIPVNSHHVKSPMNFNKQHGLQYSTHGFKKKALDLQLSADDFIRQSANDLFGRVALDQDCLNLSLNIRETGGKKSSEHRSIEKRSFASSSDIIDLEDPNSNFPNNDADHGFTSGLAAAETYLGDKYTPERFAFEAHHVQRASKAEIRHQYYGATSSRTPSNAGLTFPRHALCQSGFGGHFGAADFSTNHKRSEPCGKLELNLNTVQREDLSCYSSTHYSVLNPFMATLSTVSEKVCASSAVASSDSPSSWRKLKASHNTETCDIYARRDTITNVSQNLVHNVGNKFTRCNKSEFNGGKPIFIDLASDSDEELFGIKSDPIIESVGLSSKLSHDLSYEIKPGDGVGVATDLEKVEKSAILSNPCQNESAAEQLTYRKLSSSREPKLNVDQHSSSSTVDSEKGKKAVVFSNSFQNQIAAEPLNCHRLSSYNETEINIKHQACSSETLQSGVWDIDLNFPGSDTSEMVEMSPTAVNPGEEGFSEIPEAKIHGSEKESEVDETAQTAAESLVQISLERRDSYLGGLVKSNLMDSQTQKDDQPQHPSDSYEEMVLNAKECGPDDYCISSHAFVVHDAEIKDSGYKLKRGTRMKDFQKDILPSLSTLARHEIGEDINIIEGVRRSQEYKKVRAKNGDGGDWCRSTRSKRSRIRR